MCVKMAILTWTGVCVRDENFHYLYRSESMKLSNKFTIDYRSASVVQLPSNGVNGVEMILPGGCTSTATSSSCSCGTTKLRK